MQISVLRSQLLSRDDELQTLFNWLDSVLGLSGYTAVREMKEQVRLGSPIGKRHEILRLRLGRSAKQHQMRPSKISLRCKTR